MDFFISASTDIGMRRNENQDSLFVRKMKTAMGPAALAVLCDGMGGRKDGELASAEVVSAFSDWMYRMLPKITAREFNANLLADEWTALLEKENRLLYGYGKAQGCTLGTTFVGILLMQERYFLANIGDSRAYRISGNGVSLLSHDHTLVAQEVACGMLTLEQARVNPRRNILTRCLGAKNAAQPDLSFGILEPDTVYMLCSDGFYHCATDAQLQEQLYMGQKAEAFQNMNQRECRLIEYDKQQGETDNISVITIYVQ